MKILINCLLILSSFYTHAQSSDFLLLKKNNHTKASFFAGSPISIITQSGANVSGRVRQIKNDTIYIIEYIVNRTISHYGFYFLDTVGSYHYAYHYSDIAAIQLNKNKKFNFTGSGGSLMSGSILLTFGSLISLIANRQKFSLPLLGASVGLGGVGYVIYKASVKPAWIGKKFKLQYMRTR